MIMGAATVLGKFLDLVGNVDLFPTTSFSEAIQTISAGYMQLVQVVPPIRTAVVIGGIWFAVEAVIFTLWGVSYLYNKIPFI